MHFRKALFAGGTTMSQSARVVEVAIGNREVSKAWLYWPSGIRERLDTNVGFALDSEITALEPAWIGLEPRVFVSGSDIPLFTVNLVDSDGNYLGSEGVGKSVTLIRSDGVPVVVNELGMGRYQAELPPPETPGITALELYIEGVKQKAQLRVNFK